MGHPTCPIGGLPSLGGAGEKITSRFPRFTALVASSLIFVVAAGRTAKSTRKRGSEEDGRALRRRPKPLVQRARSCCTSSPTSPRVFVIPFCFILVVVEGANGSGRTTGRRVGREVVLVCFLCGESARVISWVQSGSDLVDLEPGSCGRNEKGAERGMNVEEVRA
ncbi:hypothetical protein MLD38_011454 [Melastoma candidum]|uniref:Uncharacterized protein n=1 Tax=Melastoma candidum TaxID=119954 RepID=A0ACB9R340_9MYRT|nr:hypothetical protein MLD38_011454 [Melastoma candidum]